MTMTGLLSRLWPFSADSARSESARAVNRLSRPNAVSRDFDPWLVWPAVALLLMGLVMVYSASIAIAEGSSFTGNQPHYFLSRQALFLMVGLGLALLAFQVPMRRWQQAAPWLFMAGVALLVIVLIPGVGREVNGAQRWIPLGAINLQPSELMKLFAVMYTADYTVRKLPYLNNFYRGFLPMAAVILLVGFLLLSQPDLGAFAVICGIAFGVLFLGGLNVRIFITLAAVALIGFVLLIWFAPYRRDRVFAFLDPWDDPFGRGYQLTHALIAFGRGEWFGVGLGGSVEKLFYLPEAHTDFLMAVIAEELGFAGVLLLVVLFAIVVHRAFAIAREAINLERYFSGLVAMGVGLWIGLQTFIHMAVNMGVLPTKGLTLPLMSFGGSAIVANLIALGLLMRVDWEVRQLKRGASL